MGQKAPGVGGGAGREASPEEATERTHGRNRAEKTETLSLCPAGPAAKASTENGAPGLFPPTPPAVPRRGQPSECRSTSFGARSLGRSPALPLGSRVPPAGWVTSLSIVVPSPGCR